MDNYYRDYRVRALGREPIYEEFDEKRMRAFVILPAGEDGYSKEEIPMTYEVCPTCQGKGTHVNPSIDSQGLTQDDFDEDPDFEENYFGGQYDVRCYECKGARVVPVINRSACDPEVLKYLDEQEEERRRDEWERAAEMSMGA
jgi:hypothetical protein